MRRDMKKMIMMATVIEALALAAIFFESGVELLMRGDLSLSDHGCWNFLQRRLPFFLI